MKKKCLITGGNGFIGSFLKKNLEKTFEVKTLGKSSGNDFCVNLEDENIIITETFDYIIHTASIVHNSIHAEDISTSILLKDLSITRNILASIGETCYSKFIFISSVAIYGETVGEDISIKNDPNPKSSYGLAKYISEILVQQSISNNNLIILRLPLVNGPKPKGNILDIKNKLESGKMIIFNGNTAKRSVLEIEDLTAFIKTNVDSLTGLHQIKSYDIEVNRFINKLSDRKPYSLPFWLLPLAKFILTLIGNKTLSNKLTLYTSSLTFKESTKIHNEIIR